MKIVFGKTDVFQKWIDGVKDQKGRARILARIVAAEAGNFGDCGSVGGGVSEMRIHIGPGYRVYYGQRGEMMYLLISGGDKTRQKRDVARAKAIWKAIKEQGHGKDQ
jgi:putative addiction module killer protein